MSTSPSIIHQAGLRDSSELTPFRIYVLLLRVVAPARPPSSFSASSSPMPSLSRYKTKSVQVATRLRIPCAAVGALVGLHESLIKLHARPNDTRPESPRPTDRPIADGRPTTRRPNERASEPPRLPLPELTSSVHLCTAWDLIPPGAGTE